MVYLPTSGRFFMANVGKHTIHGSYGYCLSKPVYDLMPSFFLETT